MRFNEQKEEKTHKLYKKNQTFKEINDLNGWL